MVDEIQNKRSDVRWADDLRTAPPQEVPLLYTFVQASRSALANVFPAGLTVAAMDRIVTLLPLFAVVPTRKRRQRGRRWWKPSRTLGSMT